MNRFRIWHKQLHKMAAVSDPHIYTDSPTTQPIQPLLPGRSEKASHDYVRHGTTSLFAALDVATGKVIGTCHQRHRHQEFLAFLDHLDITLTRQEHTTIHVVMDNYGTHKHPRVRDWFVRHPEFVPHFTPTSGSWLNQVERFFAQITERRTLHTAAQGAVRLWHIRCAER